MSLQTGIMAFSNASDLGVNADDVNNFMEGLAILIFYSGVNWEVAGKSRPSTCEQVNNHMFLLLGFLVLVQILTLVCRLP